MKEKTSYEKAINEVKSMPKFHLGQEVKTPDGKGIIVDIKMEWNGLYLEPSLSKAVVWYSTEGAVTKKEGGSWVSFTYSLDKLTP
jgi:hypothetical protein